jgi:hypothetical protein
LRRERIGQTSEQAPLWGACNEKESGYSCPTARRRFPRFCTLQQCNDGHGMAVAQAKILLEPRHDFARRCILWRP